MSATAEPKEMTMFEWQAEATENAANTLAYWIEKTREDKVNWKPEIEGSTNTRCALELGSECAAVNSMMASLIRGETIESREPTIYTSTKECTDALRSSAKELGDAIRSMKPADLEKTYQLPFGPMPGAMVLQIALGNLQYHGGQVNLIQLLYGDAKFYVPGRD